MRRRPADARARRLHLRDEVRALVEAAQPRLLLHRREDVRGELRLARAAHVPALAAAAAASAAATAAATGAAAAAATGPAPGGAAAAAGRAGERERPRRDRRGPERRGPERHRGGASERAPPRGARSVCRPPPANLDPDDASSRRGADYIRGVRLIIS